MRNRRWYDKIINFVAVKHINFIVMMRQVVFMLMALMLVTGMATAQEKKKL